MLHSITQVLLFTGHSHPSLSFGWKLLSRVSIGNLVLSILMKPVYLANLSSSHSKLKELHDMFPESLGYKHLLIETELNQQHTRVNHPRHWQTWNSYSTYPSLTLNDSWIIPLPVLFNHYSSKISNFSSEVLHPSSFLIYRIYAHRHQQIILILNPNSHNHPNIFSTQFKEYSCIN